MYQPNAAAIYKQNQVLTASPKQLVVLLLEGAIKNLRHAELALEKKDYSLVNEKLIKTQNIVQELQSSLDFEAGGQIAEELNALYDFMLQDLLQANLKKDSEKIRANRDLLSELAEAWTSL